MISTDIRLPALPVLAEGGAPAPEQGQMTTADFAAMLGLSEEEMADILAMAEPAEDDLPVVPQEAEEETGAEDHGLDDLIAALPAILTIDPNAETPAAETPATEAGPLPTASDIRPEAVAMQPPTSEEAVDALPVPKMSVESQTVAASKETVKEAVATPMVTTEEDILPARSAPAKAADAIPAEGKPAAAMDGAPKEAATSDGPDTPMATESRAGKPAANEGSGGGSREQPPSTPHTAGPPPSSPETRPFRMDAAPGTRQVADAAPAPATGTQGNTTTSTHETDIAVHLKDSRLDIELSTPNAKLAQRLDMASDQLVRELRHNGTDVGTIQVELRGQGGSEQTGQNGQRGASHAPDAGRNQGGEHGSRQDSAREETALRIHVRPGFGERSVDRFA